MADYTPEQIVEFKAKEKRIVKQACIKAASTIASGGGCGNAEAVLGNAKKFLEWVYEEEPKKDVVSDISHPTPTVEQKKALDKVEEETGWNVAQVYAKFSRFPTMSNYESCVRKIKEKSNE